MQWKGEWKGEWQDLAGWRVIMRLRDVTSKLPWHIESLTLRNEDLEAWTGAANLRRQVCMLLACPGQQRSQCHTEGKGMEGAV